jgi:hypothetical protein
MSISQNDRKRSATVLHLSLRTEIKSEPIPVTGRGGLWGLETLRMPYRLPSRLTDGGNVSLTHRPRPTPHIFFFIYLWYSFLLVAE